MLRTLVLDMRRISTGAEIPARLASIGASAEEAQFVHIWIGAS